MQQSGLGDLALIPQGTPLVDVLLLPQASGPTFLTSRRPWVSKGSSSAQSASLLLFAGAHPESTGLEQCLCVTGFPSVRENSSREWQFPAFVPGPEGVTHAETSQKEMAPQPLPSS